MLVLGVVGADELNALAAEICGAQKERQRDSEHQVPA
jgi:hypothetical protein